MGSIIDKKSRSDEWLLFKRFWKLQVAYWARVGRIFWGWSDEIKGIASKLMYRQRGRFSQTFVNVSMAMLFFGAIVFSGTVDDLINRSRNSSGGGSGYLILAQNDNTGVGTLISDLPKGEVTEYRVEDGDTVSSIAQKFGVSIDTIVWENNLKSVDAIKVQQILRILPVTGVRYKVSRGETIYSIAKKLQVDPQNIIDYPFNTFTDDETFALAAGQELIVPEGIKPNEIIIDTQRYVAQTVAPIPGVVGEGNFMWPTSGTITQRYSWYHPAIDIANSTNPPIVAAATGTVISAGWNAGGYGNYVVIDHGNGFQTLYGHMLNNSIVVKAGDRVTQGQKIGTMGSTGRSTGTHCHFEIRLTAGGTINPLTKLK
jgi:murein DD-endopeptidase MepM/ murein hydrolase activator NlpD